MTQTIKRRILRIWFGICSLHALLLVLAIFTTAFQDTPFEAFGISALVVPYLLHHAGLPVLQNEGLGGWGMVSPNIIGWSLSATAWLAFYWLVANGVEHLTRRSNGRGDKNEDLAD